MMSPYYKSQILKLFPAAQHYRFKATKMLKNIFVFLRYLPGSSRYFGPPRGIHLTEDSYNAVRKNQTLPIKHIILEEEKYYTRVLPITNSQLVIEKFEQYTKTKILRKEVFVLFNARYISGHGGTVITSDDKIFFPCSPLRNEWVTSRHQSLYRIKLAKPIELDKVILIDTNCADNNYSHWLVEHMPRFLWLKKMNLPLSQYVLVSNSAGNAYQKHSYDMLQASGIVFKQIIDGNVEHISCNELVVPPYVTRDLNGDYASYGIESIDFLKSLFLSAEVKSPVGNKIYLSRRKSIRAFEYESELVEKLANYGVEEVFLEDYAIDEQARIINNANIIVGFHGAGFTNLCFCRPNTTVVEIFGADFIVTNFWGIASQLNLCYYAYCEDSYKKNIDSFRLAREANASIEIDDFIAFFEKAVASDK